MTEFDAVLLGAYLACVAAVGINFAVGALTVNNNRLSSVLATLALAPAVVLIICAIELHAWRVRRAEARR